ncbi:MAG: extracellular solute-binding protein [bacterium]|nr:extracellular solute-binding protein [bacterium]
MKKALLFILFGATLVLPAGAADVIKLAAVHVNYKEGIEKVAANYMKLHPGVRVETAFVASDYDTYIRTQFSGGRQMAPDLYNGNFTASYGAQGRWVPLDGVLRQVNPYTGKPWIDTLDENLINRYKLFGHFFYIPLDFIEIGVFYNKDVFDRYGLKPPTTWAEMIAVCRRLKAEGITPFSVPSDLNSMWVQHIGWLARLMSDAYFRDLTPLLASRPGDWDYDPARNAGWRQNFADPYDDMMLIVSSERKLMAIRDGIIRFDGRRMRAIYGRLKEFSRYWQPGFLGTKQDASHRLFLNQEAAMEITTSSAVTALMKEMRELKPHYRFDWGVFAIPNITGDPLCKGTTRGVGGAGAMFTVTKKDLPDHEKRVIDFLQYLTTPASMQLIIDETLRRQRPLTGPPVIKGVKLPPDLEARFAPFLGLGYEKVPLVGMDNDQESNFQWAAALQDYLGNRIDLDTFLRRYAALMKEALPRSLAASYSDMDPTTNDVERVRGRIKLWAQPVLSGTVVVAGLMLLFMAFLAVGYARTPRGLPRRYTRTAYLLLAPTFMLVILFLYYPALSGLMSAFTRWEEGEPQVFNGLENFRRMAHDPYVRDGAVNQVLILLCNLLKATVVPFAVAELIVALKNRRFQYFFRTAYLIPMIVPGMVTLLIWGLVYDPQMGILNHLLSAVGLGNLRRAWLGEFGLALPSIIFIGFPWIGAFGLLIYLAGLMNIPQSIIDSARMDCRGAWQRIRHIDIPIVRGQTRLLVILTLIGSLQDFQTILILTDGGPSTGTMVPSLRMYHCAFRFSHFGYGAAIGFALFLVILALTILNYRYLKTVEQ